VDDVGPRWGLGDGDGPRRIFGPVRQPGDLAADAPAAQSFGQPFGEYVGAGAAADGGKPNCGCRMHCVPGCFSGRIASCVDHTPTL